MNMDINRLQVGLLDYLTWAKWPSDYSVFSGNYSVLKKCWLSEALDNLLDTSDDAKTYPKRPKPYLKKPRISMCSSTFSSYMIIIYDHHTWSSYMIIIYDHHIWSSYMMIIIYHDHIWSSYMMILYDDYKWWSYMIIIYNDHFRW